MKTWYQMNRIKCQRQNLQCAFFLLLFCLISMCFGTNVAVLSTVLKHVEYERLNSAHSPAARRMRFFFFFFLNNDLSVQWYRTSSTLFGNTDKYASLFLFCFVFFIHQLISGLSRFSFCRQANALPKHKNMNTGFCILKVILRVPRWQHIKPHGAYTMSFIQKSLGPSVNTH